MSKVFQIIPKRIKRVNGGVLTPEMTVTVTLRQNAATPFANGAQEIKEEYKRIYGFDYAGANCSVNDFNFKLLD